MKIFKDIIIYFIVFLEYLKLLFFYIIYTLLYIDYGKRPDDDILIAKSHYYDYFQAIRDIDKFDFLIFKIVIFLIGLRFFKIELINNKQIKIFFIGIILTVLVVMLDPFGAFNWYFN